MKPENLLDLYPFLRREKKKGKTKQTEHNAEDPEKVIGEKRGKKRAI